MNQTWLAEKLVKSHNMVNAYVQNRQQSRLEVIYKIVEILDLDATKIGYEISFNKYFYKHTPLRNIEEVTQDILKLEKQSDGLIAEILNLV
jgi:transcriptional regulator with XRE-family HTH domain